MSIAQNDNSSGLRLAGVAERYVKLVLAIGQHDAAYVDAFYGPAQWQDEAVANRQDLASIRRDIDAARALLATQHPEQDEEVQRVACLDKQLRSMQARVDMLAGAVFSFDAETELLYDAVSPHHPRAHYEQLVGRIDQLLPGPGSVSERVNAFRDQFAIPADKLRAVMEAAIQAGRERTLRYIPLPAEENFILEFVSDKPWSGYNWYKGNFQSLIQINIDLPIYIDRAVDLGCHEAYPGHHVYNVLLEQDLLRGKQWQEYCVYPLFSPQSLIAEGTANYGIELSFTDEERLAFEQEVLFPLAGLDTSLAPRYAQLNRLLAQLSYADNDAAMLYLNGDMTREETIAWLIDVRLYPAEKAAQRLQFYEAMRGYVINYNLGQDMAKAYIERQVTEQEPARAQAQRWAAFRQLMASPRPPSALR
ncbi:hypothetical protein [Janthinobacterium fluminis]|uniref:DUF885 domain-containing protein n=1 Tax=Janthinobacterium fluminis TaxID=2987524 RepID=A0ABT5K1B6_9BURK|nr:hypothetical protein [Janthinobacterium fluminis]MDC8758245.1 hypothetical protein [Janthinobacterium fluminis]